MARFNKKSKKILIMVLALTITAGAALAGWLLFFQQGDPVPVYAFNMVGMDQYWGDTQESYGPVTTDKIQTVYLSDTQTVTEVLVKLGDQVKKGDVLLTYDTTLSDLKLERQRLTVEKYKLQLEEAQRELRRILSLSPMTVTKPEEPQFDPGPKLDPKYNGAYDYDISIWANGTNPYTSFICWTTQKGYQTILDEDNDILERMRWDYNKFWNEWLPEYSEPTDPSEETDPSGATDPSDGVPDYEVVDPNPIPEVGKDSGRIPKDQPISSPSQTPGTSAPEEDQLPDDEYCVVFKVSEEDYANGEKLVWQGVRVKGTLATGFELEYFTPIISDYTEVEQEISQPIVDPGSGMTLNQIAEMRIQQEKQIKKLEFDIKMATAEYNIMCKEVSDGKVTALIDGEVVSLLTEEEAKAQKQPLIKVSGGGGFFIQGTVSELAKDSLQIGQEVTVNDWNNGMTYTGTVREIGDFPSADGYWSGSGNPTASYYPFTVFVGEEASLQAGSYASIQYSTSAGAAGIYLDGAFVRQEQGRHYVLVRGADGLLEKRYVTIGKTLWGSYKEITGGGLTVEDYLAFPYGKTVKEGAPTVEGDLSDLYSY